MAKYGIEREVGPGETPRAVPGSELGNLPYDAVFQVRRASDDTFLGSAFVIAGDRLATAAHCVDGEAQVRIVGPGVNTIAGAAAYPAWHAAHAEDCDVGLIVPAHPLNAMSLSFSRTTNETLEGEQVKVLGFATHLGSLALREHDGPVLKAYPGTFRYFASSLRGQSGGPVIQTKLTGQRVIAINIGGEYDATLSQPTNAGVRITPVIANWLEGALPL